MMQVFLLLFQQVGGFGRRLKWDNKCLHHASALDTSGRDIAFSTASCRVWLKHGIHSHPRISAARTMFAHLSVVTAESLLSGRFHSWRMNFSSSAMLEAVWSRSHSFPVAFLLCLKHLRQVMSGNCLSVQRCVARFELANYFTKPGVVDGIHGLHILCYKVTDSFCGRGDFCIKRPKFPRVTYGKELCKPYLELLMGRIYAKHATSHSWGGIMQVLICIKPS